MRSAVQFKTGWLVCQAQVLSSLNIADTSATRRRGLIGQTEIETPLLIDSCKWIHTFGVKCPIDVAYLDAEMQVIKVSKMKPSRLAMPVLSAKHVLEASAGTFENWGLVVGHTLEARRT
ncbi:MAG: DUF192 domain-containing protein [Actinobacteria bacterium]|nr:DUF192 domain-containing protein [Actinomycetota bacterium]NDE70529.1 DUF192 domain-containing protein [Actinomycetota bacterium]NDF88704.1 DUF192 domain-containing protein [Actinomycetota bacterium]